jgi:glycosyltransferase involved in cell wall biosynthesis
VKILHVNKFLYRRGGAEAYMLDLAELQAAAGHEIEFYGMKHPLNMRARFEQHFPEQLDFNPPPSSARGRAAIAGRLLYSPSARRGMETVVAAFRPDVVHLHNIYHQLSPSILRPLRARGVPAVMTLHDYKLACPTYLFLAHGKVCEACLGGRFHQAIRKRCNNGSLVASSLNALEMTVHTITRAYSPVQVFLCPSRFLLRKMTEAGVFPDRLRYVPSFVDADAIELKSAPGGGVVYGGRLSHEKGVDVLVEAAARIGVALEVAGDGPDRGALEALGRRAGADVRWHGLLPRAELHELARASAVSVLPSRCHENQPLWVLESFACGVPVVGTTLGGIPDMVTPGLDGDLVAPNDAGALAGSLERFMSDPGRAHEMGRAGRARVETDFSPRRHLARVEAAYAEAIEARARRGATPADSSP